MSSLIEVVSVGLAQNRTDDAEAVLAGIRLLRPRLAELDTFEAWIAMKRGAWKEAMRLLRNLDASTGNFMLGKALLAFCQYATGDAAWSQSANEVLHSCDNGEALGLVKLMLSPDEAMADTAEPASTAAHAASAEAMQQANYMRA